MLGIVGHLAARPTVEPLLRDLLQWDPRHRISAAAALDSDLLRPVDSRIRDAYDAANGKRQRDESPMHINQRAYVRTTSLN